MTDLIKTKEKKPNHHDELLWDFLTIKFDIKLNVLLLLFAYNMYKKKKKYNILAFVVYIDSKTIPPILTKVSENIKNQE